jgi:hypothetical protein
LSIVLAHRGDRGKPDSQRPDSVEAIMSKSRVILIATITLLLASTLPAAATVRMVPVPPTSVANDFYVSNAKPLAPSPLIKLPIGAVKPEGWLRRQLELQTEGFSGRLTEIS